MSGWGCDPAPVGPYDLIYCDPPWPYDDTRTHASVGSSKAHYASMTMADLAALPVPSISATRSVMAMWCTIPKLKEGLWLMEQWKFRYVTSIFVWIKLNPKGVGVYSGLGNYTKTSTEVVLLGRKGKAIPRLRRDIMQVVMAPVGRHSVKPEEVRHRLEELFGDIPRIELFARVSYPDWDTWGDQLE